jgi:hypothetical protein
MSSGGWYLDNQMYGNKFTSVSLHYNTVLRETRQIKTETHFWDGVTKDPDLAVQAASEEEQQKQKITREWRRLGGDTRKFLDPLGNKLGTSVDESIDKQDYDEEGYSINPLLSTIMQDDFNIAITNDYSDFGSDPLSQIWSAYKTSIPTSRFFSKIFTLMADNQDNMTEEQNAKVRESFLGRGLMSMVNVVTKSNGWMTSFNKYKNAALMCQGSRFTFYNGTGINFGTLGLRVNIFPKWKDGKFVSVNKQIEDLLPYAVGNIEPVDLSAVQTLANNLLKSLDKAKYEELLKKENKSEVEINAELKNLVSEYIKFQMPPAAYEPGMKYQDAVNKGTLKLRIGPYYSLSDLVINDLSLNFSKYMVKNPAADMTTTTDKGEEKRSSVGIHEIADSLYSPLYCEVNLALRPVSKFTSDKLKEFVSGAWRKSDIKYINKQMRDDLKNVQDSVVKRYNTNPNVTTARDSINNLVDAANKDVNQAISDNAAKKQQELENYEKLKEEYNNLSDKDKEKLYKALEAKAVKKESYTIDENGNTVVTTSGYFTKDEFDDLVDKTKGDNEKGEADLLSALSTLSGDKSLSDMINNGLSDSELNTALKNLYVEQCVSDNGLTTEHALANLEYQKAEDTAKSNKINAINNVVEAVNSTDIETTYKYDKENNKVIATKDGKEATLSVDDFMQDATVLSSKLTDSGTYSDTYSVNAATITTNVNTYTKAQSDIANLEAESQKITNWENRTIENIIASPNTNVVASTVIKTLNKMDDVADKNLYINSLSDEYLSASRTGLQNTKQAIVQQETTLNSEANSKKTQLANRAITEQLISTTTLENNGWIDENGNYTQKYYDTDLNEISATFTTYSYGNEFTEDVKAEIVKKQNALAKDANLGVKACSELQSKVDTVSDNKEIIEQNLTYIDNTITNRDTVKQIDKKIEETYKQSNGNTSIKDANGNYTKDYSEFYAAEYKKAAETEYQLPDSTLNPNVDKIWNSNGDIIA